MRLFVGRRFLALCGKFLQAKEPAEGERDALGWLAVAVQNCSQLADARRFLLDQKRPLMAHLSAALGKSRSVQRRRGIAAIVRNCLLEPEHHNWLIEPPVSLVASILRCLVSGRASLDSDEMRALPLAAREAAMDENHQAESDAETRVLLLESLVALCTHGLNNERIKAWGAYAVVRELERFEKDERVHEQILEAVDILVRDREGFPRVAASATLSEREKQEMANARTPADIQREILALNEEEKALEKCAQCGKGGSEEDPLMRCTGCFSIAFCSRKCQVAKWKEHKPKCLEIQKRDKKTEES